MLVATRPKHATLRFLSAVEPAPKQAIDHKAVEDDIARKIEKLEKDNQRLLKQNAFFLAEVENTRKRFERLSSEVETNAQGKMAKAFLSVADDLGRVVAADTKQSVESLVEAAKLIRNRLDAIFKQFGVVRLEPKGTMTDPHLHDALQMIDGGPDVKSGTILDVIVDGYTINGKLLRPAKVIVAK